MNRSVSLRVRLATLGLLAVVVPVIVLLVVTFATNETEIDSSAVETDVQIEAGVSPWVPFTAAVLVLPAGVAVWWWAGRAVRPLQRITVVADEIQAGSLDRRIALVGAPTEVQALAESFDRMLGRLAESSATQRRLVEDASHQLRTPLTVATTSIDLMLRDSTTEGSEHQAGLERTKRAVERLGETVEDLLSDARASAQRTEQTGNDLGAIVREVADEHAEIAQAKAATICVSGPGVLLAACDGASAKRAISNLVDNAVRLSPRGGTVDIKASSNAELAFVSVSDEGPGIAADDLGRVFDRYWQGDASSSSGYGIGLAIVKQVAEAHAGVDVVSPIGSQGGTRFILRFRL